MRVGGVALGLAVTLGGCFRGEGTVGAICREDADCGADQACENEVCGYCGDGVAQAGELCSVPAEPVDLRASAGTLIAFDLGLDRTTELVVRGDDGAVELWRGDGAGGFTLGTRVSEGGSAGPVRLAELDEGDALDLVVVDAEARTLGLGFGDGNGAWSFGPAAMLEGTPVDLGVARARGDRAAWVAWVDERGLWQAGVDAEARTLGAAVMLSEARIQWIAEPAPLDDDDALDLAVVDVDAMRLEPWWGDGAGGLSRGEAIALEGRATEVMTLDVDGDTDADVLVPDDAGGITVIASDGEGGLVPAGRVELPGAVRELAIVDLDRDGERDVVAAVEHEPPVWALRLRGGRSSDPVALPVTGAVGSVAAADVDRDGLVELLLGPAEGVGPLRVVEVEP